MMSLESYIAAMPKVELHIHLEGGVGKNVLLLLAEQNEVGEGVRRFSEWVSQLERPDYERIDDLIRFTSGWVRQPEDLTRMAYDLAVNLHKQNVRYAEVTVNPHLYLEANLSPENFMAALNDGRGRAERAWGIQLAWILALPREEPRRADDFSRFALSIAGRRSGIVGMGLVGKETSQPVGQFERPFHSVEKKGLPRIPHAGEMLGGEAVLKTIELLLPNRIADAWGGLNTPEVVAQLVEKHITVDTSMARAFKAKKIGSYADFPLRRLYDEGVSLTIGSDMPLFYKIRLNDLYTAAVKQSGLTLEELEDVALNAVRVSNLPDEERAAMLETFRQEYERLRAEHLDPQTT
jgi:adenosine deaminase